MEVLVRHRPLLYPVSVVLAALALSLTACVERTSLAPRNVEPIGPIYGLHVAGQRFVPESRPLAGVDVQLATYARRNPGTVTLHLRRELVGPDLRAATVLASDLFDNALRRFQFEPPILPGEVRIEACAHLPDGCGLVFVLESSASSPAEGVAVWGTSDDAVTSGSATYDGLPRDLDLVFSPVYADAVPQVAFAQVVSLIAQRGAPFGAALLLCLPGFALASVFVERRRFGLTLQLAAAPAFGAALAPLLVLYATVAHVPMGPWFVWTLIGASALAIVAGEGLAHRIRRERFSLRSLLLGLDPALLVAIGIVLGGCALRAFALDGSPIPPGGDAYHHALIAQLIAERGQLPDSYLPYAPIVSFAYHFGFHSYAAVVALATGASIPEATIWAAVTLNALIGLSVFFLARVAGLSNAPALIACLLVTLVGQSSALLLEIARYPQSAALLILPVLVPFVVGAMSPVPCKVGIGNQGLALRTGVGGAILAAGLFLTHYRVATFAVVMLGLFVGWMAWQAARDRHRLDALTRTIGPVVLMAGGAALLAAPWVWRLMQSFTLGIRGSEGRYGPAYYSLDRLGDGIAHPLVLLLSLLGVCGLLLGVVERRRIPTVLAVWAAVQLVLSNPSWLGLPIAGPVDTVTVASSLFLPLSLGIAVLAEWGGARLHGARPRLRTAILTGATASVLGGLVILLAGRQPPGGLGDGRDLEAAAWIGEHLPASARLLVNAGIVHWEPDFVVPTDAGVWLPLLAGRGTTLLPMLYPAERGVSPQQIDTMEQLVRAAADDPTSPEALGLLHYLGVTHVYLGLRGGPIDERKLARSDHFRPVYKRDGVAIYELVE